GTYKTDRIVHDGTTYYVFDATDYRFAETYTTPTTGDRTPILNVPADNAGTALKVLSSSIDGDGTLYAVNIDSSTGIVTRGAQIVQLANTNAVYLAGGVVDVRDRGVVDVTPLATAERAVMTLSGVTTAGTVSFDLATTDSPSSKTTISADVVRDTTTGLIDLTALATAITNAGIGISATLSADKASIDLTRADATGIIVSGYNHGADVGGLAGSMRVEGSNLTGVSLFDQTQVAVAEALAYKFESQYSSRVELRQGQTPYNDVTITAGSPAGTTTGDIIFIAGSDVDLDKVKTYATGNIQVTTTAGANVGDIMTLEDDMGQVYASIVLDSDDLTGSLNFSPDRLANGTYSLNVALRDVHGNVSYSSGRAEFTVSGSSVSAGFAAPSTPVITAPGTVGNAQFELTGTGATAWTRVEIRDATTHAVIAQTRADQDGNWSALTDVLADGAHSVYAVNLADKATSTAPDVEAASTVMVAFTVDTQAPVAPTMSYSAPTISGTAEADSTIYVFANEDLETPVFTATTNSSGVWTGTLDTSAGTLANGINFLFARSVDGAGNQSGYTGGLGILIGEATAPSLAVTELTPGTFAPVTVDSFFNGYRLSGTTDVGARVQVEINGTTREAWVEGNTWQYVLDTTDRTNLTTSAGAFKVLADDPLAGTAAAEYSGTLTLALTPPAVAFTQIDGITSNTTITKADVDLGNAISLTGTADTTSINIRMANGSLLAENVPVTAGAWSYELSGSSYSILGNGTQTLSYVATDAAGNTTTAQQDLTVAVVKPGTAVIDRVNDDTGFGDYFTTDADGLEVFGTSEPGSVISMTYTWAPVTGATKTDVAVTNITYVNALTGVWRADLPETGDGAYTITTTATKNGISSDVSQKLITVDATAPAVPTLTVEDATAGRPAISGIAEAGAVVSLIEGTTVIANTRALSDGTWTWAPISVWEAGVARTIKAFVTDASGNVGAQSAALTLTPVDTSIALSLPPITGDNIITDADRTNGITIGGETSAAVLYVVVNGTEQTTLNLGQSVGTTITLSNAGKGYSSTALPTVTFSAPDAGDGVQATGVAVVENGILTGITVTEAGSGYYTAPTVTIDAPAPVTAAPSVSLSEGGVALASATGGSGYSAVPTITIAAPDGVDASATAVADDAGLVTFTIDNAGTGYSDNVVVTVTDSANVTSETATATITGGTISGLELSGTTFTSTSTLVVSISEAAVQATATATIADGVVTGYTVTEAGSRYATVPAVTLDAPASEQATAQNAALSTVPKAWTHTLSDSLVAAMGRVESASVTSGGINYATAPTVTFGAPDIAGGTQATGVAILDGDGTIVEIQITEAGSGYTNPPSISFSPTAGSGGVATVGTVALASKASITVLDAATTAEVQEINLSSATNNTYTFTFTLDGKEYVSGAISYNETDAASIEETLTRMGVPGATYSVDNTYATDGTYRITFGGSLQYRDVPALVLDSTALTLSAGAPTVTENPDGDAKYAVTHIVDWVATDGFAVDAADTTPIVVTGITQSNELTGATLSGTGPSGATVRLFATPTAGSETEIATTVANASGGWTISLTGLVIADGTSLVAKVTTGLDTPVESAATLYTAASPSIAVTEVLPNNTITAQDVARVLQIRGIAGIDATSVTLKLPNSTDVTAELFPEEEGQNWRLKLTNSDLVGIADGPLDLLFEVSNGTSTTTLTQTVTLAVVVPTETPTISTIQGDAVAASNLVTSAYPTLTGEGALALGEVRVYDLTTSTLLGSTTAQADGAWTLESADYDSLLSGGAHQIGVVSLDAAGNFGAILEANKQNLIVDLGTVSAPVLVGLDNDTGRPLDHATSETQPIIKGTSDAGATIEIFVDGATTADNAGTVVTANAQGQWSYTLSSALADGTHDITAIANFGGGISPVSAALTVDISTSIGQPAITTTAATVATSTPILEGTAKPLAKVTVYRATSGGTEVIGETVASATGSWRLTPTTKLADGAQTLTAKATDAVGQVSVSSAAVVMTVATRTPSITFGAVNGDNVVSLGDKETSNGVTLTGWVETGASVTISVGRNAGSATVDASGRWTYVLKEADYAEIGIADNITLTATATSALGTSTSATQIVDFKTQIAATPARASVLTNANGLVTLETAAGQAGA
ncbi:Ig-like domain-containing protein, partial [Celeribacter marinus]|uniref:Ig-like domain-containing protein n=1 Tax=Celeribacter marinus TaxID=1397108 RepID=UPI003F6B222B